MWLLLLLLAALEVEPRCARYGSSPPRLSEMCCCSRRADGQAHSTTAHRPAAPGGTDGPAQAPTHRPPVGSRAAPAAAAMAPHTRCSASLSQVRAVCVGAGWGADSRAQAPTHRPHAFEAALAYPPWRWLTLPISGHLPIVGSWSAGSPRYLRSWCSSWPMGRVGRFFSPNRFRC